MNSANDAAKSCRHKEANDPVSPCPLMKKEVQLIPLRYGLVERLSPTDIKMPYKTASKPMGIRLLRDGWLYIVVGNQADAILHEYRIEKGLITQLLWNGNEVSADKRTESIGEAKLIFDKKLMLFATYSEVQWTAVKCSQVIKSPTERQHFMQSVSLSSANALTGSKDLLTPLQAKTWLAELAEPAASDTPAKDALEEEFTDYAWEHKTLFMVAKLGALKADNEYEYENDHLYLVLNDDIGVLRDLASHQDLVVDWIGQWAANEELNQKYAEACSIEIQMTMTPESVENSPLITAEAKAELTDIHKQAIVDWIQAKQQSDDINAARQFVRLRNTLGPELSNKYVPLILDLEQNHDESLNGVGWWNFLWNGKAGTKGILDVIDGPAMQDFLVEQRAHLQRWNHRLDLITNDRVHLLNKFYQAAWYFDANQSQQVLDVLAAEYSCIKDICRSDKATEMLAALFSDKPWLIYPGFYTLPMDSGLALQEKILTKIKEIKSAIDTKEGYQNIQQISVQLNGLVNHELKSLALINGTDEAITHFHQRNNSVYEPAKNLRLAESMQALLDDLNKNHVIDPNKILRNLPNATWLSVLVAHANSGITIELATDTQARAYMADSAKAQRLRTENTRLKNVKRQARVTIRTKGKTPKRLSLLAEYDKQFKANQVSLRQLEPALAKNMSPLGEGPSRVGFRLAGLNDGQLKELKLLAQDHNHKVKNVLFTSKALDQLSVLIAVYQLVNAVNVWSDYLDTSKDVSVGELMQATFEAMGASLAAAQGLYAARDFDALKRFKSVTQQLKYGASLGRLTGILGIFSYLYIGASSAFKARSAYADLTDAYRAGNQKLMLKSAISLGAESSLTVINGVALIRTGQIVMNVALKATADVRAVAWAANSGRLLAIGLRANLLGLAVTALQLGATVWYNASQLDKYLQWMKTSTWGIAPGTRALAESELALARIVLKPSAEFKVTPKGGALILSLPSTTARELDRADIKLAAYWKIDMRNTWEPWSQQLLGQWRLLSELDEPLILAMPIYPNEKNAQHNIAIELHYRPSVTTEHVNIIRFQTSSLTQSQQLKEVTLFKARFNAPLVALDFDALAVIEQG